uniref:4Fe-4S ferredoxin-type domain-containing protein n=1 Tax=Caenorhabditis japonica TaxID=281687 RepID=A0A8R1I126_CAEJA
MSDEVVQGKNRNKGTAKKQPQKSKGQKEKTTQPPEKPSTTSPVQPTPQRPNHSKILQKPKLQILKRVDNSSAKPTAFPLMQVNTNPPPLMQMNKNPALRIKPSKTGPVDLPEESMNVTTRQAEANRKQTTAYYFSEKPGTAVSAHEFQESVQYRISNFPLERNMDILIDKKINLLIMPTSGRCRALYIRVKSQSTDSTVATGALLKLDANDKEIRKACKETIDNFYSVLEMSSSDRYPYCVASEEFLVSCHIKRVEERREAFPEAIYYCEKCDYHINTMGHARSHLESSTHFDEVERQQQREKLLDAIPEPTQAHLKAVNKVLKTALEEYKKSLQIKEDREKLFGRISSYLSASILSVVGSSGITLMPFGSATYNAVLSDSDFNVAFTTELPEGTPIFTFLEKIRSLISQDGHKADHSMDMGTSSTIIFTYDSVRVRLCWFSNFNNRSQLYLTQLIHTYTSLKPEVTQFLQLIRIWASKAQVDSKNRSRIGLPRYGFDLMAIHYLQQSAYLPVLHEMYAEGGKESEENFRKKRDDDDEEVNKTKCSQNPDDTSNQSKEQPEEARQRRMRLMSRYLDDPEKIYAAFPSLCEPWNLAKIWIGFFQYYVRLHREVVVQITQRSPMARDLNRWNKKVLHVVDPFRSDNVLSIPKVSTWQPHYFNCLLVTYLSFAVPRTVKGPMMEWALTQNKTSSTKKKKESVTTPNCVRPQARIVTSETIDEDSIAEYWTVDDCELNQYQDDLRRRLTFDGIKLNDLKCEDVEIDEHVSHIYSCRTMRRVQRLHANDDPNWEMMGQLSENGLLKRRFEKKLFRKNRKQVDNENGVSSQVQVCTVMMSHTTLESIDAEVIGQNGVNDELSSSSYTDHNLMVAMDAECGDFRKEPKNLDEFNSDPKESNKQNTPIDLDNSVDLVETSSKLSKASEEEVHESKASTGSTFIARKTALNRKETKICTEEFFIKEKNVPSNLQSRVAEMTEADYVFNFTPESFSDGYEMEMKCTHCDGSHCVESCPMMEIPPIEKFASRTPNELKDIDEIIDKYYKEHVLDERRLELLKDKVGELEKYLQKCYREDVNLTIFGSVMTGLGVDCSDIDICLRFGEGDEPPKGITPKDVIQKVEKQLRKCNLTKSVLAIISAKVPIVKFQMRLANNDLVDVDLSYYNILALYNTQLLKEYTFWTPDNRFSKLALFIKSWAKSCDIGDASRGSLSSYAHIILLISFLQQCDPPVLPRLQEDFRNGNGESRIVEKWDTFFVQAEQKFITNWAKNKETCAQLLIGYMDYYSRFDFRNFVVQCRREMILCKMEKDWPKPLCVEDPFDLNHNLSSGITKRMFVFIMKVFISSRAAFMSHKPDCPRDSNFLGAYRDQLFRACSQGTAPNDRQCHLCHRIGHFYESCPQRKETRMRLGSKSSNSSYRSLGNNGASEEVERLVYHKRTFYRRFNR